MSIVVIGFGNTLRGDDALGPVAARMLEARFGGDGVQVLERPTLTPELAVCAWDYVRPGVGDPPPVKSDERSPSHDSAGSFLRMSQ